MWTIPIALAAGNVVILKPSEKVQQAAEREPSHALGTAPAY